MRTACWGSALLVALAVACAPRPTPRVRDSAAQGGEVTYSVERDRTIFDVALAGTRYKVGAERDATVAAGARPIKIEVVAVTSASVVLVDTYASQPGGMSMCQAGHERFLRVLSRASQDARLALSLKLESCRDDIELTASGIDWQAQRSTLQLHWLQPHPAYQTTELTLRFDGSGQLIPLR